MSALSPAKMEQLRQVAKAAIAHDGRRTYIQVDPEAILSLMAQLADAGFEFNRMAAHLTALRVRVTALTDECQILQDQMDEARRPAATPRPRPAAPAPDASFSGSLEKRKLFMSRWKSPQEGDEGDGPPLNEVPAD